MMTQYAEVVMSAAQLSITEKIRLIEHLSTTLRYALEAEAVLRLPWHDFIEQTAGSLSATPIERPPQPPYQDREPLE